MNSMTGFGSGRCGSPTLGALSVEMRSVNSRFLDLVVRLPQELSALEPAARAGIQKRFTRGKLYVDVRFEPIPGATQRYEINEALVERLEDFCRSRGHEAKPEDLLGISGVVIALQDPSRLDEMTKLMEDALEEASKSMETDRRREGQVLREALLAILAQMRACHSAVAEFRHQVVERYRQKLQDRIADLLGPKGINLDSGRLEQEVALFADKADLSEEVTRLGAHLDRLEELLSSAGGEARGRALDFLNQEILREINTIGSKGRDLEITRQVLELKNHAESMKEQIANVE